MTLKIDPKILEKAGKKAVKAFQDEVKRSSWKSSPKNLVDSFEYDVDREGNLKVTSNHPAAEYLNRGVKPHPMTYLEDAKRPIPIITSSGQVIYRKPSSSIGQDGSWQHPGFKGKHFLDRGKEKAQKAFKDEVSKAYKEALSAALKNRK